MKLSWKSLIYIAIILVGIALFAQFLFASRGPTEISLDEAITRSQGNEIKELVIDEDMLLITTVDGTELMATIGYLNYIDLQELGLNLKGVDYKVKPSTVVISSISSSITSSLISFPCDLVIASSKLISAGSLDANRN